MKWVAVSLLVLNVLYWGWSYASRPDQADDEAVIASQDYSFVELQLGGPDPATKTSDVGGGLRSGVAEVEQPLSPSHLFACYQVGIFKDERAAKSYVERLGEYAGKLAIERQREEKHTYRVQTRFFHNEKELLQYKRLLSTAQFSGKLIKDDRGRYGLSLGLFYQEADGVALFQRARQLGFSSIELKELPEYSYTYKVNVMNVPRTNISVQRHLYSLVFPPSKPTVEKISCK